MAYPDKIELFDSGAGGLTTKDNGQLEREITLRWLVPNMVSYMAAEAKGEQIAPLNWSGHRRNRLDVRSLGNKWYEVSATYGTLRIESEQNNDNGNDPVANSINFDTSGGTEHVTQTVQFNGGGTTQVVGSFTGITGQIGHAKPGRDADKPDLKGAINVEGDQVKGVDKVVPVFNFAETWVFPSRLLVTSYVATLYELTGTVNQRPWRVFQGGEVLFLGASAEINRNSAAASVTFKFSARPNAANFKVGDIDVTGKMGWEQMSVMYETSAGPATIIRRPQFVFINTVYDAKDFTRLQLGNQFPAVYPAGGNFNVP